MSFAEMMSDGGLWALVTSALLLLVSVPLTVLIRLLRKDHPETYKELGSPRWFWGGDRGSTWKFAVFLFSAGAEQEADSRVRALCRIIQPLYVVVLAWVLVPFVVVIWLAVFGQA